MTQDRFTICIIVFLLMFILGAGLLSSSLRIDERTPLIATAITLIALTVRALLKVWLAKKPKVGALTARSRTLRSSENANATDSGGQS
jgi:hypothetical protein